MLHSGSSCALTGLYRTTCKCTEALEFVAGSHFPRCISCGEAVAWVYQQSLAPSLTAVSGDEALEVEVHVRKLQACLRRESAADPALLFALGKALLRLGRISPALEVIYGVLDHAPDSLPAHLELGRALLAFRRPQDASKVLERGAEIARRVGDAEAVDEFMHLIPDARSIEERRLGTAARRVPLNVTITRSDALNPGTYSAVNISETGLCIRSPRAELLGSFVALDFLFEGEDVHAYAKVVWCRNDLPGSRGRPFTVGLQFLHPARSVVLRIRAYVDEQTSPATLPCPYPSPAE